ncbi:uncharacterized protein C11orf52 homolog [Latimeria chalumnae]|uniref:uncharacterized protein C11orf52 homolog n=1 Tax=Latimeria chalumnae TaxID=7897 RepID=UPI0003C19C43|nr:PREDICTED: uncharacterized protein C11orf52 homolog [Latimeria chalumnae]|eukprot:XP_005987317.1 PREDICTED: uncharacterized protein C11orf52 homolog [Latimeria chalumnae]
MGNYLGNTKNRRETQKHLASSRKSSTRNTASTLKKHRKKEEKEHQVDHTYDQVADIPVYAVVNKSTKKKNRQQDVLYADIQVVNTNSQRSAEDVKKIQRQNETEYAILNIPRPKPQQYNRKKGTLV